MKCDDIEILISGYVDGELTQQESQRIAVHIDICERCQASVRQVASLKEKMAALSWPNADEAMLARLEADLLARGAGFLGWVVVLLGALVLAGFALFGFFPDPEVPTLVQTGYGLV